MDCKNRARHFDCASKAALAGQISDIFDLFIQLRKARHLSPKRVHGQHLISGTYERTKRQHEEQLEVTGVSSIENGRYKSTSSLNQTTNS